ncbi:Pre-mRNA-splicing factor [Pichia californica]|uniref:Pre-mRNA-splicing factor CWC2 n=1 Tax=Pichia californica TaxID=460514 RepID=A0A9P6WL33_9ASCO|nr:Pre-mRNA-splicing factor [[Candida] californica]KAG0688072.1 Pre-mRNA-splicing factor [[Candida] californica]
MVEIEEIKRKPARVQLDPAAVAGNNKPEQNGQVFNIWYSKWTGGENNGRHQMVHSKHRCNVDKDSGYTRADKNILQGQINRSKFFCLYFARGYCCNGKNCDYLHRIPTNLDIIPATMDCFGRERFMDYRDDMSGVGSFSRVNKTLYINGFASIPIDIEKRVSKVFAEFGKIEYVNVDKEKHFAFVKYELESQAQFAKEAMFCQSLDPKNQTEVLNIRWANEDPKFEAKKRKRNEEDEMSMEMARKLLQHFKNENEKKSQKINPKDNIKELKKEKEVFTHKVSIDTDALSQLAQLRSQPKITNIGLITGYSSSEDESS